MKKNTIIKKLFLLLFIGFSTQIMFAQTIIGNACTGNTNFSVGPIPALSGLQPGSLQSGYGQTFVPTASELDGIIVYFNFINNPSTRTLELYQGDPFGAYSSIATSTVASPSSFSEAEIHFTFPSRLNLTIGESYFWIVRPGRSASHVDGIKTTAFFGADSYTDGYMFSETTGPGVFANSPFSSTDLVFALFTCAPDGDNGGGGTPPSSNCFVGFERISDTELRMVGTGITTVSNLSGSGSFFNLIVNDLFATPPTSYDATVTPGDFTVNSFGAGTTASSTTLGNSIFVSVGLTNSVSGSLLADGSLVLTWADGVLADDVTCIPVLHQSFGNILCNPVISDITLSNISQCLEGNTFTADISVAHTQQSSLLGVNVEVSGDATASIPVAIQPDGSGQYTNSSLARRVTFVSDGQPINLTAQFVGFSNCVFSKEFNIEVDPCNIVIMPPCSIGTLTVVTDDACDGDNATFTLSFDAVSGSGDYDVIASADNAELGLTNGDVLGSIRGGATDGTGIEIIGTVPSTTAGATISVRIVDATTSTCTVPSSIPVTIAACVSTEPLPAMNRWGLILFSMMILSAGLLAYRRF